MPSKLIHIAKTDHICSIQNYTKHLSKDHNQGSQRQSSAKITDLDRSLNQFTWFWSISSNGYWFGDIYLFISLESTIRALECQQSAVHCLSSKYGRNLPQNSLVLARFLLLEILFISLDLQIKTIFTGRFQGQAGPPQVYASMPFKGWVGFPPWLSLEYRFGY